ncbi:unnamed protein product [Dracunculus medinensis]|uniref:Deoxyuridine 5'-triphosphate nucleotidohydrolase n=1 Tax=Dracunculus medinensis TaxID=318479 RepID=A0A0N4UDG1_DRAME|nr:unnamed protein product [Dracunculus medinensis]
MQNIEFPSPYIQILDVDGPYDNALFILSYHINQRKIDIIEKGKYREWSYGRPFLLGIESSNYKFLPVTHGFKNRSATTESGASMGATLNEPFWPLCHGNQLTELTLNIILPKEFFKSLEPKEYCQLLIDDFKIGSVVKFYRWSLEIIDADQTTLRYLASR